MLLLQDGASETFLSSQIIVFIRGLEGPLALVGVFHASFS